MILFRKPRKKYLYIHGYKEELIPEDKQHIYNTFKKYLDIDYLDFPSTQKGIDSIESRINISQYDCIIGFSLGGVIAWCLGDKYKIPIIMINPGFGLSRKYTDFKKLDQAASRCRPKDVITFVGKDDAHLNAYFPYLEDWKLDINWISSRHVPTEDILKNEIIKKIL